MKFQAFSLPLLVLARLLLLAFIIHNSALTVLAQSTVTATITVTNSSGIENGNYLVIQGSTWLVTNSTASLRYIAPTNTAAKALTNIYTKLSSGLSNRFMVRYAGSTSLTLQTYLGQTLTASISTNWGTLTWATNTAGNASLGASNVAAASITLSGETISEWADLGSASIADGSLTTNKIDSTFHTLLTTGGSGTGVDAGTTNQWKIDGTNAAVTVAQQQMGAGSNAVSAASVSAATGSISALSVVTVTASGAISGAATGLTAIPAGQLTGTVDDARLPATITSDITGNAASADTAAAVSAAVTNRIRAEIGSSNAVLEAYSLSLSNLQHLRSVNWTNAIGVQIAKFSDIEPVTTAALASGTQNVAAVDLVVENLYTGLTNVPFAKTDANGKLAGTWNGAGLSNVLGQLFSTNVFFASQHGSDSLGRKSRWDKPYSTLAGISLEATNRDDKILIMPGNVTNSSIFELHNGVSISGFGRGQSWLRLVDAGQPEAVYLFGNNTIENLTLELGLDGDAVAWLQVAQDNATNIIIRNCTITNTTDLLWPSYLGSKWLLQGCDIWSKFDTFLSLVTTDTNSALHLIDTRVTFDKTGRTYDPASTDQVWQCYGDTRMENCTFRWLSSGSNSAYGFFYAMNPGKSLFVKDTFFDFIGVTNTGSFYYDPPTLANIARTNGASVVMQNVSWRTPAGLVYSYSTSSNTFRAWGAGAYTNLSGFSTNLNFSTTNLTLNLPAPGVYMITAQISGQTVVASGDTITAKLRKTSGAAADLQDTAISWSTHEGLTGVLMSYNLSLPTTFHTVATNDTIGIWAHAPNNEIWVTTGNITAVRVQ